MLAVADLAKRYNDVGRPLFNGIDFAVAAGEIVALVGESGIGKSTLLNCIAGLETANCGSVHIGPQALDMVRLDEAARAALRARNIGFVFQAFHVLPTLTVAQNIIVPLLLARVPSGEHATRTQTLLERVGLAGFADRWPASLSGGELQRMAVARATVTRPALLLCDEPTGNLDSANSTRVMSLITDVLTGDSAVVLVTHDQSLREHAARVVRVVDGRVDEGPR